MMAIVMAAEKWVGGRDSTESPSYGSVPYLAAF